MKIPLLGWMLIGTCPVCAVSPLFSPVVVSNDGFYPEVAMAADGSFVVAWHRSVMVNGQPSQDTFIRIYNRNGLPRSGEIKVDTSSRLRTTVAADNVRVGMDADGDIVVCWLEDGDDFLSGHLVHRRYTEFGVPKEGPQETVLSGLITQIDLDMAADGRFVIAYLSTLATQQRQTVEARRYGNDGAMQGSVITVKSANLTALEGLGPVSVAVRASGEFLVSYTWQTVNGQFQTLQQIEVASYTAGGAASGVEGFFDAPVPQSSTDFALGHETTVADDGNYAVFLLEAPGGASRIAKVRFFSTTGPQSGVVEVESSNFSIEGFDGAMDPSGRFLPVYDWAHLPPPSPPPVNQKIRAQLYSSAGSLIEGRAKIGDFGVDIFETEPAVESRVTNLWASAWETTVAGSPLGTPKQVRAVVMRAPGGPRVVVNAPGGDRLSLTWAAILNLNYGLYQSGNLTAFSNQQTLPGNGTAQTIEVNAPVSAVFYYLLP